MPVPADRALLDGWRIHLDRRTRVGAAGSVLLGGSPWRISRVAAPAQDLVERLRRAGRTGVPLTDPVDRRAGRLLVDRGFAHPLPSVGDATRCCVVVPVLDNPDGLDRLLSGLPGPAVVVDDGSTDAAAIRTVAERHGAHLLRHERNLGPAAARNTGLAATTGELVAFVDSDCQAPADWLDHLVGHFDDPAVAVVAPRIVPMSHDTTVIGRFERTRSALDMGLDPQLVRPGSRLSFVPSAAMVVRRAALADVGGFDERLRLGEDVDLCWRLADRGWLVRYEPRGHVDHEVRSRPGTWLHRRYQYGTSAADLDARHPGRLTPARPSAWNLAALGLVAYGRPTLAGATAATAATLLRSRLAGLPAATGLATRVVAQGVVADAAAVGHLLRREWWPVGALALVTTPRSRIARAAATCMLAPIAWELAARPPQLDPVRYTLMRLAEDAAYGTGVIASSIRARTAAPLLPLVRLGRGPRDRPRSGGDRTAAELGREKANRAV